jgi:predicted nucleic acid-binding protein
MHATCVGLLWANGSANIGVEGKATMKIVVDTSIIIAVVTNEPEKDALLGLTLGAELFAPTSLHWEIGNAFSAMFKRNRLTIAQARDAIEAYLQISLDLRPVKLSRALELAARLNVYAYDAYIIACALDEGCPLLTLDSGLVYSAKAAGVSVLEVTG